MNAAQFDKLAFEQSFQQSILAIAASEKITRAELLKLSRTILVAVHATGDIAFVNRLMEVLTPINRRVATLYFRTFTGFSFSEETMLFTTKNKKKYDDAHDAAIDFLDDPLNNIWTWQARNVDIEAKPFDLASVTHSVGLYLKKADKNNIKHVEVLKAVLAAGITIDTLIEVMETMDGIELTVK